MVGAMRLLAYPAAPCGLEKAFSFTEFRASQSLAAVNHLRQGMFPRENLLFLSFSLA
jgi:hypothetical protein